MNPNEVARNIRDEADELETLIKALQFRCERLKKLAGALEAETNLKARNQRPVPKTKFRKLIDKVYGEKA